MTLTSPTTYNAVIDAPPIGAPRYSLLTALPTADDPALRWQGGYTYVSELSGAHGADVADACLGMATGSDQHVHDWVNVEPMIVWVEAYCRSTLGGLPADFEALAKRKLAAHQSYDLAFQLAANVLNDASQADAGATGLVTAAAVADLEDKLAGRLQGPPGTIWCSLGTLDMLAAAGAARLDGARWVTQAGTPIAADAGFRQLAPTGSSGGAGWMVGTGPARARLGPIEVPDAATQQLLIDTSTNTVRLQAWRAALVEVDFGDSTDTWPHPPEGAPFAFATQAVADTGAP